MKRIIATTAGALFILGCSGSAIAKGHSQPADRAMKGGQEVADESAQNADARGKDGQKGVEGPSNAEDQRTKEKPPTSDSTAGSGR